MTTSNTPYAELVKRPWLCGVTGNPVGTDTRMIGEQPCDCQGCRAARAIEALEAEVGKWRKNAADATAKVIMDTDRLMADADRRVEEERERWRSRLRHCDQSNADVAEHLCPSPVGFSDEEVALKEVIATALAGDFVEPTPEGDALLDRVARAVLAHLSAQRKETPPVQTGAVGSVPGWKLVPLEPTPGMVAAWWRQKNTGTQEVGERGDDNDDYSAYRGMLAASPSPPALEGVGGGWQAISTAPKHTEVIVAQPVGDAWIVGEAMLRTEDSEVPAWWWANTGPGDAGNDGPIYGKGPTHWMAMPSPPNCTEERGAVSGQDSKSSNCALEPTGAGANSTNHIPSVDDGRG